jgi:hypothetical protein
MAIAEAGKGSLRAMQYLSWLIDNGDTQEIRRRAAMDILAYGIGKPIERVADVTDEQRRDPTDIELARALIGRGYRITGDGVGNTPGQGKPN